MVPIRQQIGGVKEFLRYNWPIVINTAAVIAFMLTSFIQWYSFRETLKASRQSTSALIASNLVNKWDSNKIYGDVEIVISQKSLLYNGLSHNTKDQYGWKTINYYMNFLEEISFYHTQGVLDLHSVDILFGAVFVEAYLNGEIRDYVAKLRHNGGQKTAYLLFETTAQRISDLPSRAQHVIAHREDFRYWTN